MPNAKTADYSLKLPSDKAFEAKDDDKNVREYVNSIKSEFYGSQGFKNYKSRCETSKYLINQLWEKGKKVTKFGFRQGMFRAAFDNYRDSLHDIFDLDEWVYLTPQHGGAEAKRYCSELQDFMNNMLRQIGYKKMLYGRLDYIPDYGWSPAYGDFSYSEGYKLRPGNKQTSSGISFESTWSTIGNKPVSRRLHPYAWFGPLDMGSDFPYQGYMKRWYLQDVYAAEQKVTEDKQPVYNPDAIKKLKASFAKQQIDKDKDYPENSGQDINDGDIKRDTTTKLPYVDVIYYKGSLSGCKGYYGDPAVYIYEGTNNLTLRLAEDQLGSLFDSMTHAKSHGYRSSPFSRSFLDGMRDHQRIGDLLLNLSIENQIDAMHRYWYVDEEALLDPNDFYNPRGQNTFLIAGDKSKRVPEMLGDNRSGSLQDLQLIQQFLDHDRQAVGQTDQELGLDAQNSRGDNTATQAAILKSQGAKKIRATCKRISDDALLPEIRFLTMQGLLFFSPQQLMATSKDGKAIRLDNNHQRAFLENTDFRINDDVTRDRDSEALKYYNFYQSVFKLAPQLSSPEVLVKAVRDYGKRLGIDTVDEFIPEPTKPELTMGAPSAMPPQLPPNTLPPQPQGGMNSVQQPIPQAALQAA